MADINLPAATVAQLILSIGNAAALSTKDKTSLVAAINETLATAEQALVVRFTKQSSGTITADKTIAAILAAHSSGKPVTGVYGSGDYLLMAADSGTVYFASWTGVDTLVLEGTAGANADSWTLTNMPIKGTNVVLKGQIDGEEFGTVAGALAILNRRGADHVAYSGNVPNAANVKAALDGLAIGKPLDMTADYVASGAATVAAWATMAKVVNGVASMTEYRVAPGHYTIIPPDGDNWEAREVVIYPPNVGCTDRAVEVHRYSGDDRFFGIEAYTTIEPGSYWRVLNINPEAQEITIRERLVSLPYYRNDTSADEGKILKIVKNGNEYTPAWVTLPTYDGGVS